MRSTFAFLIAAALMTLPIATSAQGRGHGGGNATHGPKTTTTHASGATATTHGSGATATTQGSPATTHGPKATAQSPKTTTRGPKTTTTASTATGTQTRGKSSGTHGSKKTTASTGTSTKTTTTTNTGPTATTGSTGPTATTESSPTLPRNQKLVDRLGKLLPEGTNMTDASRGFRNQGQFVAAVHVSNNLGLSFKDVKTRMVDRGMTLGQAIQDLRPGVSAETEATRATHQAEDDLGFSASAKRSKR